MPGLSGLDVLPRLRAERVDSKVIVLTMHNYPKLATIARCEGAFGFLLKAWVNPARSHSNRSRVRLCSTPCSADYHHRVEVGGLEMHFFKHAALSKVSPLCCE